jgi:membrane dipeptidase
MHELDLVADVSHLSQRGTDELLEHFPGKVMASHSNCRALLGGVDERHLSDDSIRELGQRGAMIGLNLLSPFLVETPRPFPAPLPRAAIEDCARHLDHMRRIHGHTRCLGLGTDADGGLGADALPAGIDHPRDYGKIAEALGARGWSEDEIAGFCSRNWERFWGLG